MHGFRSHDVTCWTRCRWPTRRSRRSTCSAAAGRGGARVEAIAPSSGDAPLVLVDGAPFDIGRGRMDGRPNARTAVKEHVQHGEVGYDVPRRGRRVLAGAPRGAGPAGRPRCWPGSATSTAPRSWTSTPAPACSPLPLSDAVGRDRRGGLGRGRRAGREGRPPQPARPLATSSCTPATSPRCSPGGVDADSDVVHADAVVLDPPRTGAGRKVVAGITELRPERVVYVACDPAALARDIALLRRRRLRAGGPAGVRPVPDDAPPRGGRRPDALTAVRGHGAAGLAWNASPDRPAARQGGAAR